MSFLNPSWALIACALVFATTIPAQQKPAAPPDPIRGPFLSATIRGPKGSGTIAMKGIVVNVGEKEAYFCFDTDLLRPAMGWTGDFLEFGNTVHQIAWPPPPQVRGTPVFSTPVKPGWAKGDTLSDPRENAQGPLPKDWAHYKGLYQHGTKVVFKYTVGKTEVLEMPGVEGGGASAVFTRTFLVAPSKEKMTTLLSGFDAVADTGAKGEMATLKVKDGRMGVFGRGQKMAIGVVGEAAKAVKFDFGANDARLEIAPHDQPLRFVVAIGSVASAEGIGAFEEALNKIQVEDLVPLTKGGARLWAESAVTKGTLGNSAEAYTVDTITEPLSNPWRAKTFVGGFDFFPDGRAAVCMYHGDVFLVDGIDEKLEKITWRRFATGLFQALGVKVVDGKVYVLGRDQITRLHDLNGDGEADYYENFNNDSVVSENYHEFSLDLHTDRAGNFYYAKGSPWEPEVTTPHQGTILKVSKDGSKMEVFATGFRAPNGMTVGPEDQVLVSDNQGHWMPASKMNYVVEGGFYGMTPAAQRVLKMKRGDEVIEANPSDPKERAKYKFKGWDGESPKPEGYDQPMIWLPMNMDNSSGGQLYATTEKWGPFGGSALFMSYGKCTLFAVLDDSQGKVKQGAMVQFPLRFNSGIMRGRVNPKDGQVYVAGLRGWQTSATRDGGFYRVRYTGKPVRMPNGYHATEKGIKLTFTCELDKKVAEDPANYNVERWNYLWSGAYGSADYSVSEPQRKGRDKLTVAAVKVGADGKSVYLEIKDMRPADQIKVQYSLDSADGEIVSHEVYGTTYKLASE